MLARRERLSLAVVAAACGAQGGHAQSLDAEKQALEALGSVLICFPHRKKLPPRLRCELPKLGSDEEVSGRLSSHMSPRPPSHSLRMASTEGREGKGARAATECVGRSGMSCHGRCATTVPYLPLHLKCGRGFDANDTSPLTEERDGRQGREEASFDGLNTCLSFKQSPRPASALVSTSFEPGK